ncbi:hypothetical protein V1290_004420 [Bradyrhizobium sp. AZCC 1578]|uniref:hypothetical protein n=1 Tax=Bradyrhizobium sp. AZCC 1578 TaxID=3117027 RepID=UPI002FF1A3FF
MDSTLFLTLFLFAVQTAAGVAPMKWPQRRWLADAIFYLSGFFATICLVTYLVTNRDWLVPAIQPSHVIALGLAIAFGGLLWQWRQAPIQVPNVQQPFPSPTITPSASTPPAAKTLITYSERDIRELLDGLAEAHDLVEKRVFPATHKITEATANWHGRIPNHGPAGFARALREMNAALPDELWKPIDALLEKYSRVTEQLRFALALDHEAARGEISRALKNAIDALEKLPENPSETTRDLVRPQFAEAYRQGEITFNWITVARTRIAQMTQNLRTKGVTGFE